MTKLTHFNTLAAAGTFALACFGTSAGLQAQPSMSTLSATGVNSTSAATRTILDAAQTPHVLEEGYQTQDWVQIISVIVNAIFDDDGPVDLSAESLDQIRQIVRQENFNQDRGYYIAGFRAFHERLSTYRVETLSGAQEAWRIDRLVDDATELAAHTIYTNPNYSDFSWRLTEDYGLIASLHIAVAQEHTLVHDLNGDGANLVAQRRARKFHKLGAMADSQIANSVHITETPNWNRCSGQVQSTNLTAEARLIEVESASNRNTRRTSNNLEQCSYVVTDDLANRSARYDIRVHGAQEASQLALSTLNEWHSEHASEHKGEHYASNLYEMQSFEGLIREDAL